VSNGTGCRDTLTQNYVVINDVTSVNGKFSANDIMLYPVPAAQQLQVQLPAEALPNKAWISNMSGQKMWEADLSAERTSIETGSWATGIYCFYVQMSHGTYVKKLIVQR
jgi:hypothetical protein